ncbi:MAG: general secretion pathway protein GspB [Steroidobacteraceae bacterium]
MSFILDALKKSEHARQRQAGPTLFEVKVVQPRRTVPIWAVVIVLLVLINVMTLGWIVLKRRHGSPPTQPPAAAAMRSAAAVTRKASRAPAPVAQPAAVFAANSASAQSAPPSAAQRSPDAAAIGATPTPSASAEQSTMAAPSPGATTAPNPADFEPALQPAASAPASRAAQSSGSLPLYAQIAAEPGSTLPRLHLDLHVYNPRPRKRFVMINMQKLRQGDALADGVSVVQIRPDGVVLSYQGREFLLPR